MGDFSIYLHEAWALLASQEIWQEGEAEGDLTPLLACMACVLYILS